MWPDQTDWVQGPVVVFLWPWEMQLMPACHWIALGGKETEQSLHLCNLTL